MNGHLKRVLILLLIFTFVFQMAGVTSLSHVQAYAETEEAVLDIFDAEEAEDMTTEEIDTESPGEIETDGENPPDEAAEPAAPEAASEESAEVPEETPAEETITVEEPAEEPAPAKAPVLKAATKAEKTGTVLAFTSDTHNKSGNTAATRLGTWIEQVESIHGDIDVMGFGGDMAGAGASGYWDLTQADINMLTSKDVPGVYTTGNHEINMGGDFRYSTYTSGGYSSTETKGQFELDKEVAVGKDYRIYALGSRSDSQAYPEDQRKALDDYLTDAGNDKVIFIITHFPLHYYSNGYARSTNGASEMIDLLNNAVTRNGQTIVFLWGHNHTLSDTYYDQIYGPGGVDSIQYSSSSSSKKPIEFYYGGAGCMSDSENSPSSFVKGKGLVATITQNRGNATLEFTYYGLPSDAGVLDVTESNSIKSVAVTLGEAAGGDTGTTYTLTDKLEAGKEYLIASGNSGDVLLLSNESAGARQLNGISATVSDGKITIDDDSVANALFTAEANSNSSQGGFWLKSGSEYLYANSSDGLGMVASSTQTGSSNNKKSWHYKADGKNLLWFFADSASQDGYTDTSGTYKYFLDYSSGTTFTDGFASTTSLANTSTPAVYLFTKDDGSGGDDPTPDDPDETVNITPATTADEKSITIGVGEILAINVTNGSASSAYDFTATLGNSGTAEIQGSSTVNIAANGTGQFVVKGLADGTVDITIQNDNTYSLRKGIIHLTVGEGGGDDSTPTEGTRYVLTNTLVPGKNYIIATGNSGTVHALTNNNNSIASTDVNVEDNTITTNNTNIVFTAQGSGNTVDNLVNGGRYLRVSGTGQGGTLSLSMSTTVGSDRPWAYSSDNKLTGTVSNTPYYVYYTNTFTVTTSATGTNSRVTYLFEEVTEQVAVTGVNLNKSTLSLTEGQSETLTATVQPANATNKAVTWSSSNESVATVNNGTVTAVGAGEATVTVTTADGGKTATCAVTVTPDTTPKTKYVEVTQIENGKEYIIGAVNTESSIYAIKSNGTNNSDVGSISLTVKTENGIDYVETSDEALLWTSEVSSGTYDFKSGTLYLYPTSDRGVVTYNSSRKMTFADGKLSFTSQQNSNTYYIDYLDGAFNTTTDASQAATIRLFEKYVEPAEEKTYVKTNTLEPGKSYIIVNKDSGEGYALTNNAGNVATTTVVVADNKIITDKTDIIFTTAGSGTAITNISNDGLNLYVSGSNNSASLTLSTTAPTDRPWVYSADNKLTNEKNGTTYYLYFTTYSDNYTVSTSATSSTSPREIYLFVEQDDEQHTHTYGDPTWTWAEGNTSATATFTCTEGDDTQTVTDSAPVETVVTAAGCETNKVVKYTATVTFNGEQYTNDTDNITVPDSALGHDYGEPTWTWDGFTAATATFTCANDASHTQTVNATITSAAQGGVTTYTATVTFEGQTYTDQKADNSKLITSASATFTYPIVGDDVTMGRNATVPEGANYSVYVYEYRDANGNKLTSGTFEAGETYYAEYTFDADPGYGFKGGAADTSGQVPALGDRVALTINGSDATSLIDAAYTFSRVSVYVQFTPGNPEFNLTISTYGVSGADGTAALSATKAHRGDEITVTATPAAGSAFEYAEYKRAGSQENPTRINNGKFNMPPYDVEVTAVFTKAKYTIAVTSNNEAYGTASISEPQSWYNMGDEVTLTATAKDGYEFSRWNVISGGVNIANDKFTVGTENVEIQAVFAPKNYSLKFYANEGDTDTYAVVTKAFGDTITEADLPAAPTKAFYTFNGWTPEIPETMPAEDKTFNATWTAKEAYYLVGSMNNWTVSETYEFVASPQNPGEYTVAATLTANDQIKVVKAVAGVKDESNYYPSTEHPGASGQTGNYIVDQYHAGGVTVYFRPAGNTDEGWQDFGGYFYIEGDHAVTVETSPANSGTAQVVRGDGSGAATSAPKGMSLTVNATPADNYQLDKIEIWKTNGGTEAEETLEGNTFNMPDYDVTVKVYFKVVNWTFVDFTWEQTTDGYKAVANYTGDDESTKTVNAEVTAETTAATCEEAGEIVYTATIAQDVSLDGEAHNATKTVVIPAGGHTYGDLIAEVPATCTADGVKAHYECSVCHKLFNADKTETTAEALKIAATGHDWSYKNFTWTGDEETGYTAATVHYVCRNDADHTRAINVTVTSETNAPTCENAGSTVYTATVAAADSPDGIGHTDTRTVVIPATEHSWKFENFTWTGNDEEGYTAAVANYKCENDEEHTQTVNATVTSETTAASCEVAGSTVYTATVAAADSLDGKVCTDTKTVEIPATGHKWVKPAEWTWIGDDENGYTGIRGTFTCENDPEHTREVQSTEEVTVKRVEPTATQAGSITYTVNVTGPNGVVYEVEKEIIIPPAGYTFKDPVYTWTKTTDGYSVAALKECNEDPAQNITETVTATYAVTTHATCEDDGVGTYTAAFTKSDFTTQTKPEDIPATGHTPVTDAAVAPTCTETGLTEGSHCSVCGDILTAQETVPALGHDWRQPTEVWNSDHTSVVLTFVCNRDTSHTETVTASGSAITSEVTTEPTATTPGVRTYTATVTFDGKTYTLSDTEVIPVTGSSVSGNITSFVGNTAEGEVTVQLFAAGSETAAYTATVTGNTSYAFAGVANGTYTMKVSKKDHATRSYEITVAGGAVTQDVKIHLLGDINGDGDITTVDAARVNAHAKGSTLLTDYNFACGDINGDGDITTVDAARTNAHAKGATLIW